MNIVSYASLKQLSFVPIDALMVLMPHRFLEYVPIIHLHRHRFYMLECKMFLLQKNCILSLKCPVERLFINLRLFMVGLMRESYPLLQLSHKTFHYLTFIWGLSSLSLKTHFKTSGLHYTKSCHDVPYVCANLCKHVHSLPIIV